MNSIEQRHINEEFKDEAENKTMEDYFQAIQSRMVTTSTSISDIKTAFKQSYPDTTDWSF